MGKDFKEGIRTKAEANTRTLIKKNAGRLTNIVQEIRTLHIEIYELTVNRLEKAIRIGELLTVQKATLDHGAFLPWIEESLPFGSRQAQNYMTLFARKEELLQQGEELLQIVIAGKPRGANTKLIAYLDLSPSRALARLKEPREKHPAEQPPEKAAPRVDYAALFRDLDSIPEKRPAGLRKKDIEWFLEVTRKSNKRLNTWLRY